jgi:nucleotide-binding universal stress UspA family protein
MTILVGYPINRRAKAVLSLAGMLARSSGEDLIVCTVIPAPWMPGLSRADQGYRSYIDDLADGALAQARADLPADVPARFTTVNSRSAPSGLVEAAEQHQASMVAVGSSAAGQFGYITLSSVADRLLHSSPIPVAVAPRGFRAVGGKVGRVTLAFTGSEQSGVLLGAAETLADRFGAGLRLASFAVQLSPPATARFRTESAAVIAEWTANIRTAAQEALQADEKRGPRGAEPEIVIGHGQDWKEALDEVEWRAGDVLIIGSSESGPVARVFLGSRATKIVRHSPVPVLVVPRAAAKELSEGVTTANPV